MESGGDAVATVDRLLLDGEPLEIDRPTGTSWVNANAGAHGFYRVRYTDPLRAALLDHLRELTPLERYTLVDDAWASVLAATPASSFVETAERFVDETDLSVWQRIVGGLDQLERLVEDDAAQRLHTRIAALVGPARARLGPNVGSAGDDDRTRSLRGLLLQTAALLGDDGAARERSTELLEAYLADPGSVDPSLAAAALVVGRGPRRAQGASPSQRSGVGMGRRRSPDRRALPWLAARVGGDVVALLLQLVRSMAVAAMAKIAAAAHAMVGLRSQLVRLVD